MEGSMKRRCNKQEACGKCDTNVWACIKLSNKEKKKKKYTMALKQLNTYKGTYPSNFFMSS